MTASEGSLAERGRKPVEISSPAVPARPGLSITDFLTDGSLAALCRQLTELSGVEVQLRDPAGRLIASPDGLGRWQVQIDGIDLASLPEGSISFPVAVEGEAIGHLILSPGKPKLVKEPRKNLERVVSLLALTSAELCEHELELRHRIKELSALFKLSSLLAKAQDLSRVLDVALDSALDVLGLDAGSIMLLREDADGIASDASEADLKLQTARRLSKSWLELPASLSKDRIFDKLALAGEVVVSEDLATDPRVQIPDKAAEEGLTSAIHAGLVFQNRPLGVVRLYSRSPRRFSESDRRLLGSIAQQSAVAIEQARLLRLQEEESRIQRQVQLAADVQRRMLPTKVPTVPSLDIAARAVPSFELGGDFYDFIELNGHLGVAIGDVVGKGVAAALLMSAVRASLRAHAEEVYDLDVIVSKVNASMCRDTLDNEFATLWYGVIDPNSLRLTYCSAGHEPAMIVRVPQHRPPSSADIDELSIGGMVLGVDRSQRYQRAIFDLKPGDVFIAYTDGLTDAASFSGAKFGKKRLRAAILDILAKEPNATASRFLDLLHWEVRRFTGLAPRIDDETIVVIRVTDRNAIR